MTSSSSKLSCATLAKLATNIAEDVVFATTGWFIRRHRLSREELDKLR
jgi:hypothetical protein